MLLLLTITVSAGNNPNSTEMAKALGMLSQVRPMGEIHLRLLRFYNRVEVEVEVEVEKREREMDGYQ